MSAPTVPPSAPALAGRARAEESCSRDRARGIAFMVLAMGLFSIMDALVKWLGGSYSTVQLVFFRSLFAFVPIAFLICHGGLGSALRMTDRRGHLIRAAVGILAMGAFFYAFANMRLADAVAIGFAAPIFVTALSVPLLGERVGARRWAAVLIGFAGVMVMLRPGAAVFDPVAVVPLVGVVFYALAAIMVRRLSKTETSAAIVFTFTLSCTLVSGLLLPFFWVTPDAADFALLACVGLIGGLAQIIITKAFRLADVAVIMPFEYSAMIWAALLGFFIWGEVPGNHIWLGVAIVTASGLYILYRETSLGLPRGAARRLQTKR